MPPARKVRAQNRPRPHTRPQSSPDGLAARQAPQSLRSDQVELKKLYEPPPTPTASVAVDVSRQRKKRIASAANFRPLPPGQVFRFAPAPWAPAEWTQLQVLHPPPAAGQATDPIVPLAFDHPPLVKQPRGHPPLLPVSGIWTPVCPAITLHTEAAGIFAAHTSTRSSRRRLRPDDGNLDGQARTHRDRLRPRRDGDSADFLTSVLPGQKRTARPPGDIDFSAGSIASDSNQSLCTAPTACYPVSSASTFHRGAASPSSPPRPLLQQPKGAVPWSVRTSADLAWDPWPDPLSSLGASLAHLSRFGKITHLRQAACGLVEKCAVPASRLSSTENSAEPNGLREGNFSGHPASMALSELSAELETERTRFEARLFDSFSDYALYADAPGSTSTQSSEDEGTPSTSVWGAFCGSPSLTLAPGSDPPDAYWVGAEGSSSPALASSGIVQRQDVDTTPITPIKFPAIISHHGLLTPPPWPPTFEDALGGPSEGSGLSGLWATVDSTWQYA